MTKSIFEDIPGMGPKRIRKLWMTFDSLEIIKKTTMKNLKKQTGFSEKLCSAILECAGKNGLE